MSEFVKLEPVRVSKVTGSPKLVLPSKHNVYASARTRYFFLLLYPDNELHMEVFDWVQKNMQYIAILHDRDLADHSDDSELGDFSAVSSVDSSDSVPSSDDSESIDLKKPHYHVLIRFPNCRTIAGVRKYFGFTIDRFIQECSDPYASAMYMTHNTFGSIKKNKYRYSLNDVLGTPNLKKRLFSDFQSLYTEQILTQLIEIIENRNCMSLRSLIKYLILSQQFDLLDYTVSHVYVVNNLLLSSVVVPDCDSDDVSCSVSEPYKRKLQDDVPLVKQRFFRAVDDLLHDSVSTAVPDLIPQNRAQRRRRK